MIEQTSESILESESESTVDQTIESNKIINIKPIPLILCEVENIETNLSNTFSDILNNKPLTHNIQTIPLKRIFLHV